MQNLKLMIDKSFKKLIFINSELQDKERKEKLVKKLDPDVLEYNEDSWLPDEGWEMDFGDWD